MKTLLRLTGIGKKFLALKSERTLFRLTGQMTGSREIPREIWALENIDFEVKEGDKIAVIGRNGAGKTTLFRLAAGIYEPTCGQIERNALPEVLFRFGVGIHPELSVLDNIFLLGAYYGLSVGELKRQLPEILHFAGLEKLAYMNVKNLSSGQAQRLSFSVFSRTDYPFLIFDESLTVADLEFHDKCLAYFKGLADSPKTCLMASHQLDLLERICSRALWLEGGKIREYGAAAEVFGRYRTFCVSAAKNP